MPFWDGGVRHLGSSDRPAQGSVRPVAHRTRPGLGGGQQRAWPSSLAQTRTRREVEPQLLLPLPTPASLLVRVQSHPGSAWLVGDTG